MSHGRGGRIFQMENYGEGNFGFVEKPMPVSRANAVDSAILRTFVDIEALPETGDITRPESWRLLSHQASRAGWTVSRTVMSLFGGSREDYLKTVSPDGSETLYFGSSGLLVMRSSGMPDGSRGVLYQYFYQQTEVDGPFEVIDIERSVYPDDED